MTESYIGLDVSKSWIDAFERKHGSYQITMQALGIIFLIQKTHIANRYKLPTSTQ